MSFWEGLDAVVFNTSPRIFDGLGDACLPEDRTLLFQNGEILAIFRNLSPKFKTLVKEKDWLVADFDFNCESLHRADLLAKHLLEASHAQPQLRDVKILTP